MSTARILLAGAIAVAISDASLGARVRAETRADDKDIKLSAALSGAKVAIC